MSDSKDNIRSMLQNFINDNHAQAEMDSHTAIVDKMRELSGTSSPGRDIEIEDTDSDIEDTDPDE